MKARWVWSIIGTFAVTSPLIAQTEARQPGAKQEAARTRATEAQQEQAVRKASEVLDMRRASTLIGKDVVDPDGDVIGEVTDLVMDDDGRATHIIVSHGGTAGINAKQVAIPWSTTLGLVRNDRIVMDEARLASAPTLPDQDFDFTRRGWSQEFDRYWERVREAVAPGRQERR